MNTGPSATDGSELPVDASSFIISSQAMSCEHEFTSLSQVSVVVSYYLVVLSKVSKARSTFIWLVTSPDAWRLGFCPVKVGGINSCKKSRLCSHGAASESLSYRRLSKVS